MITIALRFHHTIFLEDTIYEVLTRQVVFEDLVYVLCNVYHYDGFQYKEEINI
jgi:hypothetical protein